ncbi:hypothetical protein PybrP1_003023 [[Pythium] brassicae (nom. inval.)]|nr:hypothetical protein PybrP1_003023 [[Pythium] brassicae (nom. inval.)]
MFGTWWERLNWPLRAVFLVTIAFHSKSESSRLRVANIPKLVVFDLDSRSGVMKCTSSTVRCFARTHRQVRDGPRGRASPLLPDRGCGADCARAGRAAPGISHDRGSVVRNATTGSRWANTIILLLHVELAAVNVLNYSNAPEQSPPGPRNFGGLRCGRRRLAARSGKRFNNCGVEQTKVTTKVCGLRRVYLRKKHVLFAQSKEVSVVEHVNLQFFDNEYDSIRDISALAVVCAYYQHGSATVRGSTAWWYSCRRSSNRASDECMWVLVQYDLAKASMVSNSPCSLL